MRIENVEFFPVSQRQEDLTWSFALANYPVIDGWVIVLRAEGATGHGYASAIPHMGSNFEGIRATLELLGPKLVGRSALDIDPILADLDAVIAGNAQAKAGIDCALHDLAANLPEYRASHCLEERSARQSRRSASSRLRRPQRWRRKPGG